MWKRIESARHRLRAGSSRAVGWLADREIPRPLRAPLYRGFCWYAGADASESRPPLDAYPSLGAFFVRRLVDGARPVAADPRLFVSPVDGRVQGVGEVDGESVVQAKGRAYSVRDLLACVGEELELDGALAWTLYLSPRDYHRIHSPEKGRLTEVRWVQGARHCVSPAELDRRLVLPVNERAVLRLETARGPLLMVAVGALNVGRIRVVGVEPGASGPLHPPRELERGEELARFELGSTVVLVTPPGLARPSPTLLPGKAIRMGEPIGRYL